ncbi:hypothetical protein MRB53_036994 [Persea americana]|nr:hypothetical protein MRB53_036994 [Persea americana]
MAASDRIRFEEANDLVLARSRSRTAGASSFSRARSLSKSSRKSAAIEEANEKADVESLDDPALEVRDGDLKHKQARLAYQSTGVIYGDIGTSPLYVYSSTFTSDPSYDDLLGCLSLIIWSLTLIVTVKYVFIVLCADDEGEGGTFAVYTLLSRYMKRYNTGDLKPANLGLRSFLERSRFSHGLLKALAVFGVCFIMADGVLTPAQSVLGAIQATRHREARQRLCPGCHSLAAVQFLLRHLRAYITCKTPIRSDLIQNLALHDASVLKAFSPYFAGLYFVRNGTQGWLSLGGILLSFTGVEALFADLGAFSKRFVLRSLLRTCLTNPGRSNCRGSSSATLAFCSRTLDRLHTSRGSHRHTRIRSSPLCHRERSILLSLCRFWLQSSLRMPSTSQGFEAVLTSLRQAIITSTFQLLAQIMNMSYFPQIPLTYTSTTFHGQVYCGFANWLLMIGTVIVTAVYNNVCHACLVMDTADISDHPPRPRLRRLRHPRHLHHDQHDRPDGPGLVWRMHPLLVFVVWLPFITLDGLYLTSAMTKVPDGAWFTILLACILASIFILWRYGKEQQWASEAKSHLPTHHLITVDQATGTEHLHAAFGGGELTTIKGLGIFFDKAGTTAVPEVYAQFLQKFNARPEIHVFLHMRALAVPERVRGGEVFRRQGERGQGLLPHHRAARVQRRDCHRGPGHVVYTQLRRYIIHSSHGFGDESRDRAAVASGVDLPPQAYVQSTTADGQGEDAGYKVPRSFEQTTLPPSALSDADSDVASALQRLDRRTAHRRFSSSAGATASAAVEGLGQGSI